MSVKGKRVGILAANLYEDLELWYPYYRLLEEGAQVKLLGTADSPEVVQSKHGYPAPIALKSPKVKVADFDAVIVPGGYSPDLLRRCDLLLKFVKGMDDRKKVVAAICHGPWMLVSAKVLKGRTVTSFFSIKDDVQNAGAKWLDREVVVDRNLITSRRPADLPAFLTEIIKQLS